jgi:hypothetical protein
VLKAAIVARAKDAGVLRADVESSDLVLLTWGIAATADATRDIAPDTWRRHLALLLDGLRPGAAHPLPVPPLTFGQLRDATPRLGGHAGPGTRSEVMNATLIACHLRGRIEVVILPRRRARA